MGAVIAYLFYLTSSTASKLQRRHIAIRRENDSGQVDFAFRVAFITFVLSFGLLIFKPFEFNQSITTILLLSAICGVFGSFAWTAQYISQRHVEAGVTSLLGNAYIPMAIVLSSLFLNEGLAPRQLAGTVLLIVSAVMVSQSHRLSKWRYDKYFWLSVVAGTAMGFTLVAERALIKNNGITTGTLFSWGAQILILGLAALLARSKSQYDLKDTSITGGLRFVQQMSWVIYATVLANLSIAAASASFSTTVVFIAGAIFLHERDDLKRKIIGSLIATVGLLLMI